MRIAGWILLLLTVTIGVNAQHTIDIPEVQHPEDHALKGKVSSVYSITYAITLQDRIMPDSTTFVDTIQTKAAEVHMGFDSLNRMTYYKVDSFNANGNVGYSNAWYYYYNNSLLVAGALYSSSKLVDSFGLGYNRKNEVDEMFLYNRKGKKAGRVQYFYRHGVVYNIKERDENEMMVRFIRMEHDTAGRIREREVKDNTMRRVLINKYEYEITYEGLVQRNEYEFNDTGKLTGMSGTVFDLKGRTAEITEMDEQKRVLRQSTYTYNDRGLPATELTFTMFKKDLSFSYEYDEYGNWKTRRSYTDSMPVSKTHRVIEYYTNQQLDSGTH